nr:MAG TPA: hypothetical protein [Caudoviricetes sp.]
MNCCPGVLLSDSSKVSFHRFPTYWELLPGLRGRACVLSPLFFAGCDNY